MSDILLVSLNAKYIHSSLGARYLFANLGELKPRAELLELDIKRRSAEITEIILAHNPRILALGVYVWNVLLVTEVVELVKTVAPGVIVVLGGPEVSFPPDLPAVVRRTDHVICGEGEIAFRELCAQILGAESSTPLDSQEYIRADLDSIELPYALYQPADIQNRIIYVETSRGCPFGCEFCLSSLERQVRYFPRDKVFAVLKDLLSRGATQFKFVDRIFNLRPDYACELLRFFLEHWQPGMFLHFEAIPWHLPDELKALLTRFPPGGIQLEMGIQTLNPEVDKLISRAIPDPLEKNARAEQNIRWLTARTHVHLHTDLIAGLPGEDWTSFARGFDRLLSWNPQEIQVGILKRLRGAPISRHTEKSGMVYSPQPPYEILKTSLLTYEQLCDLKRVARFWDMIKNSGRFLQSAPLIWAGVDSPFAAFMECTAWLFGQLNCQSEIALPRLGRLLGEFLINVRGLDADGVHQVIESDLTHSRSVTKESTHHATRQSRQS